ncbi:hypothetical protein ACP70R_018329 [Stipagrostis hirtigluma subsp. patula]
MTSTVIIPNPPLFLVPSIRRSPGLFSLASQEQALLFTRAQQLAKKVMELPPELLEDGTREMYTLDDLYLSGANGTQVPNMQSDSSTAVDFDLIAMMSEMEVQLDPGLFSPCGKQAVHDTLDQNQRLDTVTEHPTQALNVNNAVEGCPGNTPSHRVKRTRAQFVLEQDVVSPVRPNKLVPCEKIKHECLIPPNGVSYVDYALHLWKTCPEKGWKYYPCLMECLLHDYKHLLGERSSVQEDTLEYVTGEFCGDNVPRAKTRIRF